MICSLPFEDGTTTDVHGIVARILVPLLFAKDGIIYGTYKLKSTKERRVHTILRKQSLTRQLLMQPQLGQQQTRRQLHNEQRSYDYSYDNNDYSYDYGGGDDYSGGDDGGDGCLDNGLLN